MVATLARDLSRHRLDEARRLFFQSCGPARQTPCGGNARSGPHRARGRIRALHGVGDCTQARLDGGAGARRSLCGTWVQNPPWQGLRGQAHRGQRRLTDPHAQRAARVAAPQGVAVSDQGRTPSLETPLTRPCSTSWPSRARSTSASPWATWPPAAVCSTAPTCACSASSSSTSRSPRCCSTRCRSAAWARFSTAATSRPMRWAACSCWALPCFWYRKTAVARGMSRSAR